MFSGKKDLPVQVLSDSTAIKSKETIVRSFSIDSTIGRRTTVTISSDGSGNLVKVTLTDPKGKVYDETSEEYTADKDFMSVTIALTELAPVCVDS